MRKTLRVLMLAVIVLFTSSLSLYAQSTAEQIDWDNAPPSLIHQKLWESKAQHLLNKDIIKELSADDQQAANQTNYDVLIYDIDLDLDFINDILSGSVTITAKAVDPTVSSVEIDLYGNMVIDSIVSDSDSQLIFSRYGHVVTVNLDQTYLSDEVFSFTIYYYGTPTTAADIGFIFYDYKTRPLICSHSQPYGAKTWWPCKDRMDDKADSFHIALTSNSNLYIASNGTLDSVVEHLNSTSTYYYTEHYPMAAYLFSLSAHDFRVWYDEWVYNSGADTLPLVHAVVPEWYDYSLTHFDVTPNALEQLSKNFGPYPYPDEKYGHANFAWGGGMEHQTMTSMGATEFAFSERVVVHELAHQWWGDMITCESWSDIWLNEGWASYAEAIYYYEEDGWQAYHDYMNSMRYEEGGTIYVHDTTHQYDIFSLIVYDKGAWACHMLRHIVGETAFFNMINTYYNSEYKFGSLTTEQYKNMYESVSGMELDWFFEDWIYNGTYMPNYHYSFYSEPSDTGGYDIGIYVEQVQSTAPFVFRMPIDFSIEMTGQPDADTIQFFNDARKQLYTVNVPYEVDTVKLDPSDWILKYVTAEAWSIKICGESSDLSAGEQYHPYRDTIMTIGTDSIQSYVISGSLPSGYSLGMDGVISGTTADTGLFTFRVQIIETYTGKYDLKDFEITVVPSTAIPGDIDISGEVNISDLLFLVEYQFNFGTEPPVLNIADVDADCTLDISDVLYFVDYQFDFGPDPMLGCVE